jgi:hypothetical protein
LTSGKVIRNVLRRDSNTHHKKDGNDMQIQERSSVEDLEARGGQFIDAIRELIDEGNMRKVYVKRGGRIVAEFPLTLGVVGTAVAPGLVAVGAIAALLTECTIDVEREPTHTPPLGPMEF